MMMIFRFFSCIEAFREIALDIQFGNGSCMISLRRKKIKNQKKSPP